MSDKELNEEYCKIVKKASRGSRILYIIAAVILIISIFNLIWVIHIHEDEFHIHTQGESEDVTTQCVHERNGS
jgi:hypothetical protein